VLEMISRTLSTNFVGDAYIGGLSKVCKGVERTVIVLCQGKMFFDADERRRRQVRPTLSPKYAANKKGNFRVILKT
jgi:hypothetical protein